ncbi:tetratricopeptide repeat protein [Neobacillus sp. PS3-34]|uniref:tetratricopeptide repeat protein n=1 Tax=Neobacillus sp. PS3-34 TaxID=3070678 RepID=UPI0027E14EC9|nr:tetratricopeptide repeat protein [Neobacillus sp. PS3-34]WML46966.1 tetratricopeptide repeat protein [Neobacillus sp. PS3-34]
MGKDSKARKQKGKILTFIPTGEYYFTKGLKAYHRRDFIKAKKYLQRALQLEPGEPMIACQLAIVRTELGEYENSNQILHLILDELDEEMVECHYFLANNYAHMGFFKDAYHHAKLYMELEPDGDFTEDTEDLMELLTLEAEDMDDELYEEDDLIAKQEQARDLLESGYFPKAIELLNSVVEEYPEYWSAYNNLALAYFYLGETEKAESILMDVLERNQGNLHALCNLLVFAHYRQQTEAVEHLTSVIKKINPILTEHQFKLGATFALVGEYEPAYSLLRKLYKQGFDGDGPFYYWLSYAAYHTGHEKIAHSMWEKVLEINPEKEGFEPWNEDRIQINGFEDHVGSIFQKIESDYVEERLFALFLISVSAKKETILSSKRLTGNDKLSTLEKEYLQFIKSGKRKMNSSLRDAHETAEILYEYHHPVGTVEAGLYLMWFSVFSEMIKSGTELQNKTAWAAAMEYVWMKLRGEKMPQKEAAERYGVSVATVGKYVKLVNSFLQ